VLGEQGWTQVEPLLGAWLDWPGPLPADPAARAVCVAFAFALHAGVPVPKGGELGAALQSFKGRFKLDQEVIDLLVGALAGA
jgi:UDP-N-acetylmuramyl pentapeptide synthase